MEINFSQRHVTDDRVMDVELHAHEAVKSLQVVKVQCSKPEESR